MSCDICGRGSCTESFHSVEEQERYSEVIDAFERTRDLRRQVRDQIAEEELEAEKENEQIEEEENDK